MGIIVLFSPLTTSKFGWADSFIDADAGLIGGWSSILCWAPGSWILRGCLFDNVCMLHYEQYRLLLVQWCFSWSKPLRLPLPAPPLLLFASLWIGVRAHASNSKRTPEATDKRFWQGRTTTTMKRNARPPFQPCLSVADLRDDFVR